MSRRVREAMRRMSRDLHREMAVPALYIAVPGASPLPCSVRQQDLPLANGKPGGVDAAHAQRAEAQPRLIFLTDDAPKMIRQQAVVSVEPGVAYRIVTTDPAHGLTITARVIRLTGAEAAGLPVP